MQTESALGCLGNDVPGQSQGTCKTSGYRRLPSRNTSVNPADLVTKPIPKARIEQFMSLMGYEFVSDTISASKGQATMTRTLTSGGTPTSRQNLARREPPRHLRRQQIILMTGHVLRVQEMLFSVREKLK